MSRKAMLSALFLGALGTLCRAASAQPTAPVTPQTQITNPFVSLPDVDPSILLDIRYATAHNFVGRPIKGYRASKCLLTRQAAQALRDAQQDIKAYGLSLKVYDCFRPQRAVDDFVAWAKNAADLKMKNEFYPNLDKADLFRDGYIAAKSSHSRGSTMDLTLVPLPARQEPAYTPGDALKACTNSSAKRFADNSLDMGTGFDCFDPLAHTANTSVNAEERRNRRLLKSVMEKHGFKNLPEEWWHYTLKDEPYPTRYFDFDIGP